MFTSQKNIVAVGNIDSHRLQYDMQGANVGFHLDPTQLRIFRLHLWGASLEIS